MSVENVRKRSVLKVGQQKQSHIYHQGRFRIDEPSNEGEREGKRRRFEWGGEGKLKTQTESLKPKALIWIYYAIKGSWHSYGLYICAAHWIGVHNFNPIRLHSKIFTSAEFNNVNDCRSCALQQSVYQFCFRTHILHLNIKWWLNTVSQLFIMQKSNFTFVFVVKDCLAQQYTWLVSISCIWQLIIIRNPQNTCLTSFHVFRVFL